MGGVKLLALVLATSVASAAMPWPASAQCRLCDAPVSGHEQTTESDDIRLELETNLNFDRLILFGDGVGTAVIRPDGSSAATGSIEAMSPRAMVGTVVVHGQPNRLVRVDLPKRIDLFSISGGRVSFDDVQSDLSSMPKLDAAGNLTFRFGGRITITGSAEGQFRGDLPITVEYL
jgi:hypothetical protein